MASQIYKGRELPDQGNQAGACSEAVRFDSPRLDIDAVVRH
jgi:hypothetical protein